mmetsp:Transcript_6317/g.23838  ORF Transcript_6317/g.23838 Transcript_6317/m.23838 type:complete len:246 (+) Transcript_6317:2334-3071(+)
MDELRRAQYVMFPFLKNANANCFVFVFVIVSPPPSMHSENGRCHPPHDTLKSSTWLERSLTTKSVSLNPATMVGCALFPEFDEVFSLSSHCQQELFSFSSHCHQAASTDETPGVVRCDTRLSENGARWASAAADAVDRRPAAAASCRFSFFIADLLSFGLVFLRVSSAAASISIAASSTAAFSNTIRRAARSRSSLETGVDAAKPQTHKRPSRPPVTISTSSNLFSNLASVVSRRVAESIPLVFF